MIAALQMYDWAEVRGRTDRFWAATAQALRRMGVPAPAHLIRPLDLHDPWLDPGLLLGQTCGLPYVSGLCGDAVIVARPGYATEGAFDGTYRSAIVVPARAEGTLVDFRNAVAAVNDFGSLSGCLALAGALTRTGVARAVPFFGRVAVTGSHRASAALVADGGAAIAAIDAVAWALFAEWEPERRARLRVLEWTRAAPALPFITAPDYAELAPLLLRALSEAAAKSTGAPGIPRAILPAGDGDYDPVRRLADRVRGVQLAPGCPPLGEPEGAMALPALRA